MSSLGRTISQIRSTGKNKAKMFIAESFPIGIKTPLELGKRDNETLFKMHFSPTAQIQDNLRNLIMTQKGERIGFPDYGTNMLQIYSNTSLSESEIVDLVVLEIQNAVSKYMPSIFLKNFYSERISGKIKDQNKTGFDFSNSLSQVGIGNAEIAKQNSDNVLNETIYKLDIEYNISTSEEENQNIILYIKTAK